ncbi:MAG: hypothetical protein KF683_13350 [Rubrivivax sp.]|nr:hypothetical protein [Rubrivivax sp.]
MQSLRRRLRPAAWLATVAVLLLALLPTLGHAWSAGSSGWTLVCGTQGPRWVALGEDGAPVPAAQAQADCLACLWTAAAPPVPTPLHQAPPVGADLVMPATAVPLIVGGAWRLAAPRGPPQG